MVSSQSSVQTLVEKFKLEMFSSSTFDVYSFVSPSAYETAWLAMVPDQSHGDQPMFNCCLDWVLNNQKEEEFWGESRPDGRPTIDALLATLACVLALKMWNVGDTLIQKGLAFVEKNTGELLKEKSGNLPRWFTIAFCGMIELAEARGLDVLPSEELKALMADVFFKRQQILETEGLVDQCPYPPLLSYLEVLPSTCDVDGELILKNLSKDGSLFQSPSATARAFMATKESKCEKYLQSLIRRCSHGVPPMYPMDGEFVKLCLVNQILLLGLAEYFTEEIGEILSEVYRTYKKQESRATLIDNLTPAKMYKNSLAFRLLRMHGYDVSPWSFCWFLRHEDIMAQMENNSGQFRSAMLTVHRATDLMFQGEYELKEARSFARKMLEKNTVQLSCCEEDDLVIVPNLQTLIEHELDIPWIARMDYLDHRFWIEATQVDSLWLGKASLYRLSCLQAEKLMVLAVENFKFRQLIYQSELQQLEKWAKDWGLRDMGFGREKTTYCYYAAATSSSSTLPPDSLARLIVAKTAILVTVADDFFDMEGSLNELRALTEAVERWDGQHLSGHCRTIFDALDGFVTDMANKHLHQHSSDILENLRNMWRETFRSWMMESSWMKSGYVPSMEEYIETGMTSIAVHMLVLPPYYFINPKLPKHKLILSHYETITKLLMAAARLLNDIQSYQKEQIDGKTNLVLLTSKAHPEAGIEDSIAHVQEILDEKTRELVEHAFMDHSSDLPKPVKLLHLSCLKTFQMFFHTCNRFDSDTLLSHDIERALYRPVEIRKSPEPVKPQKKKEFLTTFATLNQAFKHHGNGAFAREGFLRPVREDGNWRKVCSPPKFSLSVSI
ncbi:(E,E)-geranyllinalool synthase [Diospyros lotus]|uniref:(E,E)-geranyllinalool synthase n=1 Tax=Diospyros lotus TaxID=55363 RepID=UPI00225A6914|nr:(E,E)-geranyllinalool synthase [Diospyros lotus]